jgi:hypothetical protein
MKTRKTLEGSYEQGQVIEITHRKIEAGKVVLDVVSSEEVYRSGTGVVVKSDCWLGAIDGNLPVEFAHHCVIPTDAIRQAGYEAGMWWGKKIA